ncbi:hypothetical protein [uncultured Methanolobus sp.]|uniref:Cap15 family cyclic dinucleotide receptor domain-containing protein n=1 Tax=uncultured Methanolobus sp. TaxID=218300 RepID=UPI0029C86873|nr:hypothetical protein [uncultured Methanolobus sp.]
MVGVASFAVTLLLLKIFNVIVDCINSLPYVSYIPYIPQIATFGFVYLFFFKLFDRRLWKKSLFGFSFSQIPNLAGSWKGHIKSNYNEGTKTDITVDIEQTWSSISIILKTATSKSESEVASISLSKSRLVYQYFNEPSSNSAKSMHKHYGFTFLDFENDNSLKGSYFTCRDRQNNGDIYLRRIN